MWNAVPKTLDIRGSKPPDPLPTISATNGRIFFWQAGRQAGSQPASTARGGGGGKGAIHNVWNNAEMWGFSGIVFLKLVPACEKCCSWDSRNLKFLKRSRPSLEPGRTPKILVLMFRVYVCFAPPPPPPTTTTRVNTLATPLLAGGGSYYFWWGSQLSLNLLNFPGFCTSGISPAG